MKPLMLAAVFSAAFAVNVNRACPSVFFGDSPETVVAAVFLDVSHPPGAPLMATLGKLATLLPVGNPAFRINLLACSLGAGIAVLVAALAFGFLNSFPGRAAAGIAAVAAVISNPVMVEAMGTAKGSVYLLAALLLLAAAHGIAAGRPAQSGFALGLLAAHHWMTLAALAPVFAVALLRLLYPSRKTGTRPVFLLIFVFALGASLLVYLPLRASHSTPLDWGAASGIRNFISHVARATYFQQEVRLSPATWIRQAAVGAGEAANGAGAAGLALACAGIPALWIARRAALAFVLAASFVPWVISALYLDLRPDIIYLLGVYLLPVQVCVAFLSALGAGWLALRRPPYGALAAAALAAASMLFQNHKVQISSPARYTWSYDTARALLSPLPREAGLLLSSDLDTFPAWYLQYVEEYRPDVLVVNSVLLKHSWYRQRIAAQTGARFTPEAAENESAAVASLLRAGRRRWFCSAAPPEGLPQNMRLSPFHFSYEIKYRVDPWKQPRGMTLRGFYERTRRITSPVSRITAGYTAETLQNLVKAAVLSRYPPD